MFSRSMKRLPSLLQEALLEAELDDPVVLRSFPRASVGRLGLFEGGTRAEDDVPKERYMYGYDARLWRCCIGSGHSCGCG